MLQFPRLGLLVGLLVATAFPSSAIKFNETELPEDAESVQRLCAMYAPQLGTEPPINSFDTYFTWNLDDQAPPANETSKEGTFQSADSAPERRTCRNCVIYDIKGSVMRIRETIPLSSANFEREVKCKISLKEIEGILGIFQEFLKSPVPVMDSSPQEAPKDECQEMLRNIRTTGNAAMTAYQEMIHGSKGVDTEEYHKQKNSYEDLVAKLWGQFELVKKQADQEARGKVDEAESKMHQLRKTLDDYIAKFEEVETKSEERLVTLISLYIKGGDMGNAKDNFDRLSDKKKISQVISMSYNHETVDKILLFCSKLDNLDKARLLRALVSEMHAEEYRKSLGILVVSTYAENVKQGGWEARKILSEAKENLKVLVDEVLKELGHQMTVYTHGNSSVARFAQDHNGIFNTYFRRILFTGYSLAVARDDAELSATRVIEFVDTLHSMGHEHPNFGRLAYHLIDTMIKCNAVPMGPALRVVYNFYKQRTDTISRLFDNRKFDFVQNIIYGLPTVIYNTESLDNLVLGENYDSKKAIVKGESGSNWQVQPWKFETSDGTTFQIRTYDTKQWLYAATHHHAYSATERRVLTWRAGGQADDQGQWQFRGDHAKKTVALWNKDFGEYLNMDESGKVFTWRDSDGKGPRPYWYFAFTRNRF